MQRFKSIKRNLKKLFYLLYPLAPRYSARGTYHSPALDVLLVSLDDPQGGEAIGGKHVHLFLLEKGLRNLGRTVQTLSAWRSKRNFRGEYARLHRRFRSVKTVPSPFLAYLESMRSALEAECYAYLIEAGQPRFVNAHDVIALHAFNAAWKKYSLDAEVTHPPTTVLTLHGYFTLETIDYKGFDPGNNTLVDTCMGIERDAVTFTHGIIAVDTRILTYVRQNFAPNRPTEVIVNAIDTENFCPLETSTVSCIKTRLKLESGKPIIIVPRRLVKKNGVRQAAEAAKIMADQGTHFRQMFRG